MRGTGPVAVNGTTVYAYYMQDDNLLRVRISVDEAERLGIFDGLRVAVALPSEETKNLLVTALNRIPPYVWVHLKMLAPAS